MKKENILDKTERLLEWGVNAFTESLWFKEQESVGTIRVLDAFPDRKFCPGYDLVFLDFGALKETDESPVVYRVPHNLVRTDQIVEVIVKRAKLKTDPETFLVAVRPFERQSYGKPFRWAEAHLSEMFGYNMKTTADSKMFYKKFLEDKLRKEPTAKI